MSVRAKFTCTGNVPAYEGATEARKIDFMAVADVEGSNKDWAKYTPSGQLTMQVDNPPAAEQFIPGKSYFLDFTPAE